MSLDWIDDILKSEPISNSQIAIIEGLLTGVPYEPDELKDIENGMLHLSYQEAYELIVKLKIDYIPKDPREQFKKMFRYGN
tara:strand:+ start:558 stop:800 length:243 start_codon:yes stop_codon:yes gene_type:complete